MSYYQNYIDPLSGEYFANHNIFLLLNEAILWGLDNHVTLSIRSNNVPHQTSLT